ncbi:MAG: Trm112 family protein [Planctomycetota bacterium]
MASKAQDPARPTSADNCASSLDPELLKILRCPESHGLLIVKGNELWCAESRKAYRVESGIPVMLIEEARTLTAEELASIARR